MEFLFISGFDPCIIIAQYLQGTGKSEGGQLIGRVNVIRRRVADRPLIRGFIVGLARRFQIVDT